MHSYPFIRGNINIYSFESITGKMSSTVSVHSSDSVIRRRRRRHRLRYARKSHQHLKILRRRKGSSFTYSRSGNYNRLKREREQEGTCGTKRPRVIKCAPCNEKYQKNTWKMKNTRERHIVPIPKQVHLLDYQTLMKLLRILRRLWMNWRSNLCIVDWIISVSKFMMVFSNCNNYHSTTRL